MSHYCLLLITATKPTETDIEKAMSPFYETEDNDNSKWDWYQVGGRWSGQLEPDYDPEKDPRNIEPCDLCQGTGMRNDEIGRAARVTDPNYTCNACEGNGSCVMWPTQWANDIGNQVEVKTLKPNVDLKAFAYLHDGRWIERGSMGWFGAVSDEKDDDSWAQQLAAIIASLKPSDWLTVIDCHI